MPHAQGHNVCLGMAFVGTVIILAGERQQLALVRIRAIQGFQPLSEIGFELMKTIRRTGMT